MSETIIDEAKQIVNEKRQTVYGHPYDDFGRVSELTKPILESSIDSKLKHALYMIQVKISRLLKTPDHHDSLVDIIGYVITYTKVLEKIKGEDSPF